MKSSIKFNILTAICPLTLGAVVLLGCSKGSNDSYEEYGPVDSLTATFTVTPVPGTDAKYVLTNTTQGDFVATKWDLGKDTSGGAMGKSIDTAFYPLPGTYSINMYTVDKRGKLYRAAVPVNVTTTLRDPAYENLIKGANMNAGDEKYWKTYDATDNKVIWTINNNYYRATTAQTPVTSQVNGGIYQAVQVVANKTYEFTANVSYGAPRDAWMELYFGTKEPANKNDYAEGGKKAGPIVWGKWNAFTGPINPTPVKITFGATGTAYVVIKTGCNSPNGSFSGQGLNVTNVSLRRTQE